MPLDEKKKVATLERLNRDPDFRDEFHTSARNMYKKALVFNKGLEDSINRFEQILGADPHSYEFENGETNEMEIFEQILDAYDNQMLLEEKENSTIN